MNYFIRSVGIRKNNNSTKFHKIFIKKLKIESLRAGFWRPRDNFIRNQKIKYFLLVREYISCLNEGFEKKNQNLNFWQSCMKNSTIFSKN